MEKRYYLSTMLNETNRIMKTFNDYSEKIQKIIVNDLSNVENALQLNTIIDNVYFNDGLTRKEKNELIIKCLELQERHLERIKSAVKSL